MREWGIDTTAIIPLSADFNSELRKNSLESMRDRVERMIGVHVS